MLLPSLKAKYIYLSLLQQYFESHDIFTWNKNPEETKVIITDKYATELGVTAIRPSIILDRGGIGWTNMYRKEAERLPNKDTHSNISALSNGRGLSRQSNYAITDILQTNLTINIIAKVPYSADTLANEVFYMLTAYRERLKEKGVHKVTSLQMGKESIIKTGSDGVDVTVIPISVSFLAQETVSLTEQLYNCRVYLDEHKQVENSDYIVTTNGTQILFKDAPADTVSIISVNYTDAITLEEKIDQILIPDGNNNRLYTVPNSGRIYGYYKVLSSINFLKDNEEWTTT